MCSRGTTARIDIENVHFDDASYYQEEFDVSLYFFSNFGFFLFPPFDMRCLWPVEQDMMLPAFRNNQQGTSCVCEGYKRLNETGIRSLKYNCR